MVKYKYNHWIPRLLHAEGVTIGRSIYFLGSQPSSKLLRHELVHVEQYEQYGVVGLLTRYLFHYLKGRLKGLDHWGAYYQIPFEVEAYKKQEEM